MWKYSHYREWTVITHNATFLLTETSWFNEKNMDFRSERLRIQSQFDPFWIVTSKEMKGIKKIKPTGSLQPSLPSFPRSDFTASSPPRTPLSQGMVQHAPRMLAACQSLSASHSNSLEIGRGPKWMFLKHQWAYEVPGDLVKTEILIQKFWSVIWDLHF